MMDAAVLAAGVLGRPFHSGASVCAGTLNPYGRQPDGVAELCLGRQWPGYRAWRPGRTRSEARGCSSRRRYGAAVAHATAVALAGGGRATVCEEGERRGT